MKENVSGCFFWTQCIWGTCPVHISRRIPCSIEIWRHWLWDAVSCRTAVISDDLEWPSNVTSMTGNFSTANPCTIHCTIYQIKPYYNDLTPPCIPLSSGDSVGIRKGVHCGRKRIATATSQLPSYLANDYRLVTDAGVRRLRPADTRTLFWHSFDTLLAIEHWLWQHFVSGTVCYLIWQPDLSYGQFRQSLKTSLFG